MGFCFSHEFWKTVKRSNLEALSESSTAVQNQNCTELQKKKKTNPNPYVWKRMKHSKLVVNYILQCASVYELEMFKMFCFIEGTS